MQAAQELLKTLYTMAMMVETRDAYTGGHLWRVSRFSGLLAQEMGLPRGEVLRIMLGGFLHDLGKIGVPDAILNKRDRLTDDEYAVIKTHPQQGADLLREHPLAALAMEAVLMHHETPDGRGYPAGLKGEAIPMVARIVGIADAFDAMTSHRPYRAGMPIARALDIIRENLGSQFDRTCGEHFIALGEAGKLEHIVGHSEAGIPMQQCQACGPIIAIPRRMQDGDTVHCPSCGGGYRLHRQGSGLALAPTGEQDPLQVQRPVVDHELVAELVQEASACLQPVRQGGWLARLFA